jgi:hypothetical protein
MRIHFVDELACRQSGDASEETGVLRLLGLQKKAFASPSVSFRLWLG